jgi:AraC-like DNA-binding protein
MRGSAAFVCSSPDDFAAVLADLHMHVLVMAAGRFVAQVTHVAVQSLRLTLCEEALPRIAHMSLAAGTACVLFPIRDGSVARFAGVEVGFGQIILLGAGQRLHARTPPGFQWGAISFAPAHLSLLPPGLLRDALTDRQGFAAITPPLPQIRRLLRLHRQATAAAQAAPEMLRAEGAALGLEGSLADALADCLRIVDTGRVFVAGRRHDRRAAIINAMEDLIAAGDAHRTAEHAPAEPTMSASRMSAALGVSGPLLRQCCREHLGMSRDAYLRLRRLNQARTRLEHAGPAGSRVRDLAASLGFREPGRFAVQYRSLFGESPSVTRRRAALASAP